MTHPSKGTLQAWVKIRSSSLPRCLRIPLLLWDTYISARYQRAFSALEDVAACSFPSDSTANLSTDVFAIGRSSGVYACTTALGPLSRQVLSPAEVNFNGREIVLRAGGQDVEQRDCVGGLHAAAADLVYQSTEKAPTCSEAWPVAHADGSRSLSLVTPVSSNNPKRPADGRPPQPIVIRWAATKYAFHRIVCASEQFRVIWSSAAVIGHARNTIAVGHPFFISHSHTAACDMSPESCPSRTRIYGV